MHLVNNNRVYFDDVSHTYLLDDDKVLTGVTTLMKKYGLSPDYSGIPESVLRKAAEEGTAIHKEIEDYLNGVSVLNTELIEDYKTLNKKFPLKHIASEYIVSDNETVASAIDGVFEGQKFNNTVMLIDYKTTTQVHTRSLEWQLGIYKVLFERQNPGIKVDDCWCLHIDKKKRRILKLIRINPVSELEVDALLAAEKNGKPYVDTFTPASASLAIQENLPTYIRQINLISELKARLKEAEAFIKDCDSKFIAYMQENNLVELSTGEGTIKLKNGYQRKTVDTAKLAKDYPQLASKYEKITEVSPSIIYKSN